MQSITQKYLPYIFFLLLISSSSFLSTFNITESPPFWYDEGYFQKIAVNLSRTGDFVIQTAPGEFVRPLLISTGYPLLYPVSVVFTLFGEGVLQARLVMAFFLVSLVTASFLLSQKLFGFKIGAATGLLIASFPPLYGHGKSLLGEIPGLFFLLLFIFFIYKIEQSQYRKGFHYLFAGLAAGLCVSTKPLFILLLPAFFLAVILKRKSVVFHWNLIALGIIFFLIPVVVWLVTQFDVTSSPLEIFSYYADPYVVVNFWELAVKNTLRFFTEASPAYFFSLFLVWTFSLLVRICLKHTITLAESISFLYALFIVFAYLRLEGWYRYFFTANIITLLFFPHALFSLLEAVPEKHTRRARSVFRFAPIVVVASLFFVHAYKLQADSFVARSYNDTKTAELNNYFRDLNPDKTIFVYDIPQIVAFLPHDRYYQVILFERKTIGDAQPVLLGIPDMVVVGANVYEENNSTFTLYKTRDYVEGMVILEKI